MLIFYTGALTKKNKNEPRPRFIPEAVHPFVFLCGERKSFSIQNGISQMILVTGANGLLGSRLLFDLASRGHAPRAFRRKGGDDSLLEFYFRDHPGLFARLERVDGDVRDVFSLEEAMKGVEQVYHCAARVSFSPASYRDLMQVNMEGTANVVNMCLEAGVKKLCHVSSVAAIGRTLDGEHITEETLWKRSKLNSAYAISKYGAEREVWRGMAEGLDAVIVNPSVILGRGNWMQGSASMIRKIYEGLRFYTTGVNGFVDVEDVSRAMILLMESPVSGERFILNSENMKYQDFFSLAAGFLQRPAPTFRAGPILSNLAWRFEKMKSLVTGREPLVTRETARTANNRYFYSNEKVVRQLGLSFIPVEKSLQKLCAQFLAERP